VIGKISESDFLANVIVSSKKSEIGLN